MTIFTFNTDERLVFCGFFFQTGSEISESALVRDLVYVFQGIDGHIVKFSHTEDAFRINPEVGPCYFFFPFLELCCTTIGRWYGDVPRS